VENALDATMIWILRREKSSQKSPIAIEITISIEKRMTDVILTGKILGSVEGMKKWICLLILNMTDRLTTEAIIEAGPERTP